MLEYRKNNEKTKSTILISRELLKRIKWQALIEERTISDIATKAIEKYLNERKADSEKK